MEKILFCAGMPRCATTWLHAQITRHPAIPRLPRKEIHFFLRQYGEVDRLTEKGRMVQFQNFVNQTRLSAEADDRGRAEPLASGGMARAPVDPAGLWGQDGPLTRRFEQMVGDLNWYLGYLQGPVCEAWYRRLFAGVGPGQWAVDFSTTNGLISDEGFARMARFAPEARVLLILRHPLDRLWSHLKLQRDIQGVAAPVEDWPPSRVRDFVETYRLMRSSVYAPVVTGVIRHFRPEHRLILSYDDILRRPAQVLAEVLGFLGLELPPDLDRPEPRPQTANDRAAMLAALAPWQAQFLADLDAVAAAGVDLVRPWIADLQDGALLPEGPRLVMPVGLGIRSPG